jgi:hypothetical protein
MRLARASAFSLAFCMLPFCRTDLAADLLCRLLLQPRKGALWQWIKLSCASEVSAPAGRRKAKLRRVQVRSKCVAAPTLMAKAALSKRRSAGMADLQLRFAAAQDAAGWQHRSAGAGDCGEQGSPRAPSPRPCCQRQGAGAAVRTGSHAMAAGPAIMPAALLRRVASSTLMTQSPVSRPPPGALTHMAARYPLSSQNITPEPPDFAGLMDTGSPVHASHVAAMFRCGQQGSALYEVI